MYELQKFHTHISIYELKTFLGSISFSNKRHFGHFTTYTWFLNQKILYNQSVQT